jgi:hypothetical protein
MRSRLRNAVVAVAAVCAMSVVMASAASASLPEYSPIPNKFELASGEVTLETATAGKTVHCKTTTGPVELHTFQSFTGQISFNGCKAIGEKACTTTGATAGTIKANVPMQLVYLAKATHEVGIVFNYQESGKVTTFATFGCGAGFTNLTLRGAVIAQVTPVNKKVKAFTLALSGSKGTQGLTQYENTKGEKVTVGLELGETEFQKASLNASGLELQMEKEGEISG